VLWGAVPSQGGELGVRLVPVALLYPISGERLIACSVVVLWLPAVQSVWFGFAMLPRVLTCGGWSDPKVPSGYLPVVARVVAMRCCA
jgi:hypothetical protein